MNDKPYTKVGKTYYPKPKAVQQSSSEVKGSLWRAWKEDSGRAFFEYDAGHFATKMRVVEISLDDFDRVKAGSMTDRELVLKYR